MGEKSAHLSKVYLEHFPDIVEQNLNNRLHFERVESFSVDNMSSIVGTSIDTDFYKGRSNDQWDIDVYDIETDRSITIDKGGFKQYLFNRAVFYGIDEDAIPLIDNWLQSYFSMSILQFNGFKVFALKTMNSDNMSAFAECSNFIRLPSHDDFLYLWKNLDNDFFIRLVFGIFTYVRNRITEFHQYQIKFVYEWKCINEVFDKTFGKMMFFIRSHVDNDTSAFMSFPIKWIIESTVKLVEEEIQEICFKEEETIDA